MALGHFVAVFTVCAEHPDHSNNAAEGEAYDGRIGFPVGGLGVPTTGRRPDVLGVPIPCLASVPRAIGILGSPYGIFPPPPIVVVSVRVFVGVLLSRSWARSLSHA